MARQALGMALMRSLYVNMQAPPPTEWPPYGQDIDVQGKACLLYTSRCV